MNGVLIIDKPAGITSHDVVDRIRRELSVRRVGHLGTLDPLATGVLPLTIGKATRLARFIPGSPKEYTGQIRLGWATTTCDLEGAPLGEATPVEVDLETVRGAMALLTGRIEQLPPEYSAKKVSGVAAYRLARQGRPVGLQPALVEIHEFALASFDPPLVSFRVVCSAGTYIRGLARDLGNHLGTGAHLYSLRRTRSGPFPIASAVALERAGTGDLISVEELMQATARIEVDDADAERVRHGLGVVCARDTSPLCIFNKKGQLIAVASVEKGWAHPEVVLL